MSGPLVEPGGSWVVTVKVPAGLVAATTLREGDAGREWLQQLPGLVAAACDLWDCTIDGDPTHGQVALVVPVRHASGPAVVKVSFPHPGNLGEAAALRAFAGRGSVQLLEEDETGLVLLLERTLPLSLAEHAASMEDYRVEEAIEVAGDLARQLTVDAAPGMPPLADPGWTEQLRQQVAAHPDALPATAIEQAAETIEHLIGDTTATMLHGDLHFGNILRSHREPWLTIDPKGWTGTAAFDTFTVVAGRREELDTGSGLYRGVLERVYRFASAALVHPDLALACCQARAVSSYFYQLEVPGSWFDMAFLHALAIGSDDPAQAAATHGLGQQRDRAILAAGFETGFWNDRGVPAPWPSAE